MIYSKSDVCYSNYLALFVFVILQLLSGVLCGNYGKILVTGSLAKDPKIIVQDFDNSTFTISRINKHPIASCYQINKGNEFIPFCYPTINVVGVRKSGTSALSRCTCSLPRMK